MPITTNVASLNPTQAGILDTTLYDKVCQWLAPGRWFSLGPPVSSTNKTDCHDITEILLKVVLNTLTLTPLLYCYFQGEDKKYKPPSTLTGPLLVLEHVVKQPYFPKFSREILSMFMSKWVFCKGSCRLVSKVLEQVSILCRFL